MGQLVRRVQDVEPTGGAAEPEPALLYLRLIDAGARPRGGAAYLLRGPDFEHQGVADAEGVIEIEGCAAGAYELSAGGAAVQVHTLFPDDLTTDHEPYRVVLPEGARHE